MNLCSKNNQKADEPQMKNFYIDTEPANKCGSSVGSFGRRIRSTRGPAIAIKAMARKLGILFYNTLTKGIEYVEQGIKKYEEQVRQTELSKVTKWAGRLGYTLIPNQQINVVHQ
jgi:hypothetical protein